jgi:hypothetical protein
VGLPETGSAAAQIEVPDERAGVGVALDAVGFPPKLCGPAPGWTHIPELDHMHGSVVMARNSSLMTFQLTAYALVPNGGLKHAGRAATARAHTYRQLGYPIRPTSATYRNIGERGS